MHDYTNINSPGYKNLYILIGGMCHFSAGIYSYLEWLYGPQSCIVWGAMAQGPFKCYVTQMGVGDLKFSGKKHYKGVRFATMRWSLISGVYARIT